MDLYIWTLPNMKDQDVHPKLKLKLNQNHNLYVFPMVFETTLAKEKK